MELNLVHFEPVFFGSSSIKIVGEKGITKSDSTSCPLTFQPVLDERCASCDLSVDWKSSREICIELVFGDSDLSKKLKRFRKSSPTAPVHTHLTLTSANSGRLLIETYECGAFKGVDIFESLIKLQQSLPANSVEFVLGLQQLTTEDEEEGKLNFLGRGLKLTQVEQDDAVSLEMKDLHFPENGNVCWEQWKKERNGKSVFGRLVLNVRLDIAAVNELYERRFGKGPSATKAGTPTTDMVIFAGGNKDKEKAIKCRKSILSKISPVFAAMFQTDILEKKNGTLEIEEFSEDCVRAFVDFVYRRNVEEALKSSELALELLQMADKYEIKDLKTALQQILWYMPCVWFDVDVVIQMVSYISNAGGNCVQAESKGWSVLRYAKNYPEKLMESKEIESLCAHPRAVKELVVLLLNKCK